MNVASTARPLLPDLQTAVIRRGQKSSSSPICSRRVIMGARRSNLRFRSPLIWTQTPSVSETLGAPQASILALVPPPYDLFASSLLCAKDGGQHPPPRKTRPCDSTHRRRQPLHDPRRRVA